MNCSNTISCWGNDDDDNHFKGMFFHFFLINGFDFLAELDEPIRFEKSLACDVHFVCATQKT